MSKVKVVLTVNTIGHKAGEEIEVDATVADFLVEEGHGRRKADAPKSDK